MTQLIAKRNLKFRSAAADLVVACRAHNPPLDPVELLLEATAEHVPVHPDELATEDDFRERGVREKRDELGFYERNPEHRKSIATIIRELTSSENDWYEGQIVQDGHRTFDAREAIYGKFSPSLFSLFSRLVASSRSSSLPVLIVFYRITPRRTRPSTV